MSVGMKRRRVVSDLDLPPPYRLVALREGGDAFAHATSIAATAGAGTLVHVRRFDVAEFAVVLEPNERLSSARRIVYAGILALMDAVAIAAPPKCRIGFSWPGAIHVDFARIGHVRLVWPSGCAEDAVPDWLVFGALLQLVAPQEREPGARSAALDQAGFDDLDADELVAASARHLLLALDAWQDEGFGTVATRYLKHLMAEDDGVPELDDNGDLLVARSAGGRPDRRSLAAALASPAWPDPATADPAGGGPCR
jgi:Biotin/lipoate A/B protein ligase family